MNGHPCPSCGGHSRDGLPCHQCWRHTTQRLAELPWLWSELQATRTRRDRLHGHVEAGKSAETGLPWNDTASRTAQRIANGVAARNGLVGWVRITIDDLGAPCPRDTVPALCAHLTAWIKPLRKHEAAPELVADVWGWTDAILRVINRPEYRRVDAGPCPRDHEDAPCPGVVRLVIAADGADGPSFARCEPVESGGHVCGSVWESHQLARLGRDITRRVEKAAAQEALARAVIA